MYKKDAFKRVPYLYPLCYEGFFLDKIYNNFVVKFYNKFAEVLTFIDNRIFANYKPILCLSKLGVKIAGIIETKIMNKTVSFVSDTAKSISKSDLKAQTGNIQRYNLYAFVILTIILSTLLIAYIAIITRVQGG